MNDFRNTYNFDTENEPMFLETEEKNILSGFSHSLEDYANLKLAEDLNAKNKILVYGTLRPGAHNYQRILLGQTISEETVSVPGYSMYSNSGFPYIVPELNRDNSIVATLIELNPFNYRETVSKLDSLEGFHGYSRGFNHYSRVIVDYHKYGVLDQAFIYVANESRILSLPKIKSGDWYQRNVRY